MDYTLVNNALTQDDANDLIARAVNVKRHSQQDLFNEIMDMGAGLTMSDIMSVWEAIKKIIGNWVKLGEAFDTELFNGHPSIQGIFHSPDDTMETAGAVPQFRLSAGIVIRAAAKEIKTKKVAYTSVSTFITQVKDVASSSINDKLTPNGQVVVNGHFIAIAGTAPTIGYYFGDADDNWTPVPSTAMAINKPSEVVFIVPNLTAGTYRLKVVTQYRKSSNIHSIPVTYIFDKEFTVDNA